MLNRTRSALVSIEIAGPHIAMTAQADDGTTANSLGLAARPDAIEVLHWTANACKNLGPGLRTGDCISIGAFTASVVLHTAANGCSDFSGIGEVSFRFKP